ncbi:PLP-dependent aminotransferase family protein [Flavobacterium sp. JLP]|uniref:aminotransferase-like domain-containing protein n=1 Tax=unclassified Flavobacterium TaxID=196869 RepID=UPI00188C9683|nr:MULTISPECIES: PLP-dependent aminotransferase family protein [unclassified Flavobacterium]MBF4491223.1 PLP-dependent aminotransferase family protein [Flavobacterium sp. MR2016-29]MBF4505344.1 PLP-dependent aminotransferase family protein [Flavobacterium sp. JLP]
MNSPVQIPFKSFIQLKPEDSTSLYLQIVFEFIKAIQIGLLPEGTKLPGTRVLCKLLSVNRNTLIKAFHDLELQGWIEILPNKGTFILSEKKQKNKTETAVSQNLSNHNAGFTFKQSAILENPSELSALPFQFNDGLPDLRLVQTDVLARLYVSKLKSQKTPKTWEEIQTQSHLNFKKQFSNFLNVTRGIRISTSNLLTTSSHEISLYLVTKLLITPGDKVVVASPGYYISNMTLSDSGAQIISIPVDKDGIITENLKQICEEHEIRILYLTSNYHYPTNTALSAKRRMEILELANQYGFVILEDDYDFDFHYDNNPILPLASLDSNERVVYIGSFGRSLPSGFGYGFIAATSAFISELEKHQNILEPGKDVIKEQVLADWIQEGEVHRLSKKNKKIYKERRDYFVSLLNQNLKDKIKFQVPLRGLAIWVEWLDPFNLINLQKKCAVNGLFLPKTILYQTKNITATRLGFGHLNPTEMENAVIILKKSLEAIV